MNKTKDSKHRIFIKFSFLLGLFVLVTRILATNVNINSNSFLLDNFVEQRKMKIQKEDTSCETGLLRFDESLLAAKEFPDSHLIIVIHRGKEEKKKINRYRLKVLENLAKIRKPTVNYLFTEGNLSEGIGRVDLYVSGKLYRQIYYDKNAKTFCDKP